MQRTSCQVEEHLADEQASFWKEYDPANIGTETDSREGKKERSNNLQLLRGLPRLGLDDNLGTTAKHVGPLLHAKFHPHRHMAKTL